MTGIIQVEKPDIALVEQAMVGSDLDGPGKHADVQHIDGFSVLGLTQEDADFYNSFTKKDRTRVRRKVDYRLVPCLALLYLIAHLDRSNIGNTKILGIEENIGITGTQWNILLSLFFVPYVLLEVPSNILLKRFNRPSAYMATLVVCWGTIMTLHGVTQNFGGILALRILLGVFEAGFFPGAVYLSSFWYMPNHLAARISYFYCFSALSGAFSGMLAAAIGLMDGVGGYEGWRWLFILEGILTVAIGIMTFFVMVDTPELSGKWLEPQEIRFLQLQRYIKQGGRFQEESSEGKRVWTDLRAVFSDWKLWMLTWVQFVQSATSYGTKFTLPTLTRAMGFESWEAQLASAGPYVCGAIATVVLSNVSDRVKWRMPFVVGPFCAITIGFSIMMGLQGDFENQIGASYFAVCLACMGIYPAAPALSAWVGNNTAPASKRAIALASNIAIGNIGGIMGSYMFFDSDAPAYNTGFGISMAFGISGLLCGLAAEVGYKMANKKRAALSEENIRAQYTDNQLMSMGDKNPLFKYTL